LLSAITQIYQVCNNSSTTLDGVMNKVIEFARDESGATAIEYGLIAALVSVAAIGAMTSLGNSLGSIFNTVSSQLTDSLPTP
jgi:pilus assembly protein Flp/PilA